ncbi:concanavalin A-like lectin/glucanase domain-containing protein [Globomyces pollinis-pini]|nr:concanavalin A-like lectin/glucanase domain-containing protein [Globomyces pollinis-pini]
MKFGCISVLLLNLIQAAIHQPEKLSLRHDYRQTFKYPYSIIKDPLPYFQKTGDVLIDSKSIRVVSGIKGQKSLIWCENKNPHPEWLLEFEFTTFGKGAAGGRGFVLWYVKDFKKHVQVDYFEINDLTYEKINYFGYSNEFEGVGIVFDSSDRNSGRINPIIYGISNDGNPRDLSDYHSPKVNLGSCYREFRNTPSNVFGKLTYKDKILRLDLDIRQEGKNYVPCFEMKIDLPVNYHFGLSSSTDEISPGKSKYADFLVDTLDWFTWEVSEVNPRPKSEQPLRPHEKEDIEQGKSFEMSDKFKKMIEETEKTVFSYPKSDLKEKDTFGEEPINHQEAVQKLKSAQLHMIESLNFIQERLHLELTPQEPIVNVATPKHQEHFEKRAKLSIWDLSKKMYELKTEMESLRASTVELQSDTRHFMRKLDESLTYTHQLVSLETAEDMLSGALKIFGVLAIIAFLIVLYGVFTKGKDSQQQRKFI